MTMTGEEILRATGGVVLSGTPAGCVVTGVSTDSRTLRPGELFVPLRGPRADGHDFIADAVRRGAAAALCARPVPDIPPGVLLVRVDDPLQALGHLARAWRRRLSVQVVGVTGSVGKTSTTQMCAAVLARRYRVAATREEWNAEIGVPLLLLGLRAHHQVAVVEMAMRGPGQISALVEMAAPSVGVVTAVGEAHLEFLGSVEAIARAKGELVAGLPPEGVAVLNRDDPLAWGLRTLCRGRVVGYGLSAGAEVTASDIRLDDGGTTFRLHAAGWTRQVRLSAWGRHTVSNALAAAAVGLVWGVSPDDIVAGLDAWRPPPMRLQPVRAGDVLVINDAYNSSPRSARAALEVLAEVGRGRRRVAVLGEMRELGPRSADLHREVGALAARHADVVVAVGGGAGALAEGAVQAGGRAVEYAPTVEEAARLAQALVRPGDVILVKGSRALRMERVVDALAARGEHPGSGDCGLSPGTGAGG
ncbi:MAG: UDP-N-acetylmuramoyl-tripeptide--D-alanyl-D-alanine ligase [Armatimonadota bacterium]|nr:UDP-N-acetylmuramoyl-tripeptide--D-alanyl-D-alanine ligase [Armatimonadota bacterium]MDR7402586.1 UDP-N-acetylmuramoyl-tripeptide--D-alanyl-D-alanine ligase [Armatimonadota bacterium]MDR7404047.1 UDP-N-acetylmuramoyl-tripeptide--D-alanyl-D-alanine ligase [Armatimonadota bacterium]MDR7436812.1 UDP-N-acetylmuramoyl-tripeptide--D-alanyl-D-alanine ligase [Armatimonadota bacterium]MDR7472759.1 UDP-N-acetylmuramoyl-tripeptide--D-alanyl-D-alanine ligase [Armatimonadota bacterium]